ncbi:MAG: hypothetical protein ACYSR6_03915 [Planctomycetota bacterium]
MSATHPAGGTFELAIEHFDPEHRKGILFRGAEHNFMINALKSARKVSRELKQIGMSRGCIFISDRKYEPMSVLAIQARIRWKEDYVPVRTIREIAHRIADGCRTDEFNSRTEARNGVVTFKEKRFWYLEDHCRGGSEKCVNKAYADWACSIGIRYVILQTDSTKTTRGMLYLILDNLYDLEHLVSEISQDSLFESVFGVSRLSPANRELVGSSTSISIENDGKPADFSEPVIFKFTFGWGDCPCGCIYRHYWVVRSIPRKQNESGTYEFESELVSEGGDQIPEDILKRLIKD